MYDQCGVQVQAEGGVQRLGEGPLEGVQQREHVRHAVERQRPPVALQEHGHARARRRRHRGLAVVVPRRVARVRAAQAPRVLVAAQQAGLAAALAADAAVGDAHVHPAPATPLHLPVAGARELALAAQHLGHRVEALGVQGVGLGLLPAVGPRRRAPQQHQGGVGRVGVQGEAAGDWRRWRAEVEEW